MVPHLVAIAKLQLLAAASRGHGVGPLLAALLGPFVLKFPFIRCIPRALGDLVFSSRLFLFRLSRILFRGRLAAAADGGRWGRALRLVTGRSDGGGGGRLLRLPPPPLLPDEGSLHAMSMVVL